jgi:hypothetical protein
MSLQELLVFLKRKKDFRDLKESMAETFDEVAKDFNLYER